jgi:tetratricopeptide (TPR) repeat protein/tRNA A-37 threonylcarbamoyl transferase component Bud32
MPFANGENVGAYRIVEKLGQGGMATVYRAYHPALDRYVAIKVMHPAFTEDPNFLARFQREARIVAKLDHPHIVPIYDYAEHHGQPYLVMRFIEGETLKARMQRGLLEWREVLCIAQAVGDALTYAHGQGVLHRDIKPSNVILTPEGSVYLTDFGLARMAQAGESTLSRDMMVGTPQYISPEQAKGVKELDARTDVYSLGVVLYELLVGQPPFTADTPYAIIHDHIFAPLPLPGELNPDLSEPVQRVLLRALAKEPDDRFQSVAELVTALEATLKPAAEPSPTETVLVEPPPQAPVTPPPAAPPAAEVAEKPGARKEKPAKKKRRWLWVVAGGAALLCLIAATILGLGVISRRQQMDTGPRAQRTAEQLLEEARAAQAGKEPDRALELYRQAVEADPRAIPAYLEGSSLLLEMGESDQALAFVFEGLEDNPDSLILHQLAAQIAMLTKQWDKARGEVDWLLRETPEKALPHAYAALLVLVQDGPCDEARPELARALELDPNLAWAHYGLALCHLQAGDVEAARTELKFVFDQENTPDFLRALAEHELRALEKETIGREFEELMPVANGIPAEDLRSPFKEMLNDARRAWESGDEEGAIQVLKDARAWVKEHWDDLGDPPAGELASRLDRIIHIATQPAPP